MLIFITYSKTEVWRQTNLLEHPNMSFNDQNQVFNLNSH